MTTAASTIAPIAMAIPPSDMMSALTPWNRMTTNAAKTPRGKVKIATNAERTCQRNSAQTIATTTNSSSSLWVRFSTARSMRSEEHTYELQSLMRISYAVFCLKKKNTHNNNNTTIKHYTLCNAYQTTYLH